MFEQQADASSELPFEIEGDTVSQHKLLALTSLLVDVHHQGVSGSLVAICLRSRNHWRFDQRSHQRGISDHLDPAQTDRQADREYVVGGESQHHSDLCPARHPRPR